MLIYALWFVAGVVATIITGCLVVFFMLASGEAKIDGAHRSGRAQR